MRDIVKKGVSIGSVVVQLCAWHGLDVVQMYVVQCVRAWLSYV